MTPLGRNATLFGGCAVSQLTLVTQDVSKHFIRPPGLEPFASDFESRAGAVPLIAATVLTVDYNPRNFEMRIDRYTRFILTIIAISLTVIALHPFLSPGVADAQLNGYGVDPHHPCYIAGWGPDGTVPIANSGRFPVKILVGNPSANPMPVMVVNPPMPFYQP
jgi:hypothetical protein